MNDERRTRVLKALRAKADSTVFPEEKKALLAKIAELGGDARETIPPPPPPPSFACRTPYHQHKSAFDASLCDIINTPGGAHERAYERRGPSSREQARRTNGAGAKCRHGHLWSENETTDSRGSRVCRACRREASRRAKEKKERGY